jgi:hypothetical protein
VNGKPVRDGRLVNGESLRDGRLVGGEPLRGRRLAGDLAAGNRIAIVALSP